MKSCGVLKLGCKCMQAHLGLMFMRFDSEELKDPLWEEEGSARVMTGLVRPKA